MASKIAFCGYIGHPYNEPLKEEKPVDHWAKKDNDEVLAAGIINSYHSNGLDKPIT